MDTPPADPAVVRSPMPPDVVNTDLDNAMSLYCRTLADSETSRKVQSATTTAARSRRFSRSRVAGFVEVVGPDTRHRRTYSRNWRGEGVPNIRPEESRVTLTSCRYRASREESRIEAKTRLCGVAALLLKPIRRVSAEIKERSTRYDTSEVIK